eukprot:748373-Hanusia_phi.AAC.4
MLTPLTPKGPKSHLPPDCASFQTGQHSSAAIQLTVAESSAEKRFPTTTRPLLDRAMAHRTSAGTSRWEEEEGKTVWGRAECSHLAMLRVEMHPLLHVLLIGLPGGLSRTGPPSGARFSRNWKLRWTGPRGEEEAR